MKVAANGPQQGSQVGSTKPSPRQSEAFLAFRKSFRAEAPELAWTQFRQVVRSLFSDANVVLPKRPGTEAHAINLTRAQLEFIAENPGKVKQTVQKLQAGSGFPKDDGTPWNAALHLPRLAAKSAREVLGLGSPGLKPGPGQKPGAAKATFTVATVNDDFTDRKTELDRVSKKADIMLTQESRESNYRKDLPKSFGVHQDVRHADKAGSAVVWNKDEVKATAQGGHALGVKPDGAKMMTRWLSWKDVVVDGVKVRMVAAHRPPKRFNRLWPAFDRNLAAFVKSSKVPVIVGIDANEENPQRLAKITGLKWHGLRIDGFLVSPGIKVENLRRLDKGTSDHHPLVAKFTVRESK